ncbi:hypothetical protein BaRGS_00015393 [Batillaria attramentaria]|uniref:G-protein coupled receptors family 2 profile 2 domain-containing protein n=1 Tax=Batillaria attramentaria TaxID=370345 RepID=A0ABD0L1K4_9CAEN
MCKLNWVNVVKVQFILWAFCSITARVYSYPKMYIWNKTAVSAEAYLTGYGQTVCGMNEVQLCLTNMVTFPCDCSPQCASYGTCCSDRVPGRMTQAWSETTGCLEDKTYAMVRCPQSWGDGDVRKACETGQGKYTVDEPVTDLSTNVTFRNAFCAQCHGVESYTAWEFNVSCAHFQFVLNAISREEFLQMADNDTRICTVKRTPPTPLIPSACPVNDWFSLAVVGTCNVTGEWATEDYDADVEKNCLLYTRLVLWSTHYSGVTYQNLFCAVCNGVVPKVVDECSGGAGGGSQWSGSDSQPPLSLLLDLQTSSDVVELELYIDECSPNQWLGHSNECRNLTCTPGKVIVNGTCSTAVTQIRGLIYSLDLVLVPTSEVVLTATDMEHIENNTGDIAPLVPSEAIHQKLSTTSRFQLNMYFMFQEMASHPNSFKLSRVNVSADFTASRNIPRDEAEQVLVEKLFSSDWNFTTGAEEVMLRPASNVQHTLKADENYSDLKTVSFFFGKMDMFDTTWSSISPDTFVPLSPLVLCPFLGLNSSEYELRATEGNTTQVVLKFGDEEAALTELELAWLEENELRVCLEALESLPRPRETDEGSTSWQYILSMVAFPLSIICLVLTLIVYSLLPKLRTQPGLNTMGTCCALLLAQVTLLLASHRVTSGTGCTALGMVVHMAWLSMFCWTSVCSAHMFRVFSAKTYRGSGSGHYSKLVRNIIITILLPAVGVGLVVGVSYHTSDGASIGYSSIRCYLESALLVGVAMVLPVSIILVLNLLLFVLTVRRIHQVTKLKARSESERDSRQHVHVCARLSVLTGVTWVLSLIAEGADIDWLRAVAILTNGGQGVLLFLSYVATRRVAAMLAVRLGLREKDLTSSRTQTTSTNGTHSGLSPTKGESRF